jgi:hypothetical protein
MTARMERRVFIDVSMVELIDGPRVSFTTVKKKQTIPYQQS